MLTVRERRRLLAHAEAVELIAKFGVGRTQDLLNVHASTVERWRTGEITPSTAVLIALRAAVLNQLPGMETRAWVGWSFGPDGRLYDSAGRSYSAGDILAQQYERALIRSLHGRVRELEERLLKATLGERAANDGDLSVKSTAS